MFWHLELLIFIVTLITLLIARVKYCYQYWKRKGLPYIEPTFPYGNIGNAFNREKHLGIILQERYNELKSMGARHGGLYRFTDPLYMPVHPDIIKTVLQKDFHHFEDRGFYYNEKDDPLSANLFAIFGNKWRNLRTKLSSTFTSGKMKMMFETLTICANNMTYALDDNQCGTDGVDIKDVLVRYTTDVIGSCVFGLECNSFKNDNPVFSKYGRDVFKPVSKTTSLTRAFAFTKPKLAQMFGFRLISKETSDFFIKVIRDTIEYRKTHDVNRNDMLQILMDLKNTVTDETNSRTEENALTLNEIAAQAFVFFLAGFETSSTTMTFCLYELAINRSVQERVRDEIKKVLLKHGGKLSYEAIMDMKYMGQVIDETLRKYPPLAFLTRKCVEDYRVPGSDVIIEKGTRVFIPVIGLHRDTDYFPNPDAFDPERFSDANRLAMRQFTYLPFGEGPRICIGLRFGLMQTKVGLAELLNNYIISLNSKTATPLSFDPFSFVLTTKDRIWLNLKPLESK